MTEIGAALPRPIRIGLANLDTSHPLGYIPVIRALGHEVTGVYDDGVVFDTSYARRFVSENGLTRRYRELSDLARDVDVAYVGGCDWNARLAAVRLLANAGVGILLDKPAAATWSDLDELEELVGSGARITGGSALLGCDEVRDWVGAHGTAVTALATCHGHELDYGVHAAALVLAVCGAGVREVCASRVDHALVVSLRWSGGQVARYVLAEGPLNVEYAVTVVGDDAVDQLVPELGGLARALLQPALPYLAGRAPAPRRYREVVEPERVCIAAAVSVRRGGRAVRMDDPSLLGAGFDAAEFINDYRQRRRADR